MSIEQITENGVYSDISLERYHNDNSLFDGPSVSKSALKAMLPPHGGSPKAFWHRWKYNPDHITSKTAKAMDFGKAVHCLFLGDEVFDEKFVVLPEKWKDFGTKDARIWRDECVAAGFTVLKPEQIERIRLMALDAAEYPLIKNDGLLNGKVEQSMVAKDPQTGIWLKTRPDNEPFNFDGLFADLKTTSSMAEDFLQKQLFDCGYYLQGAMTRKVCRLLNRLFQGFVFVYVLNDEVPDTGHVELSTHELDRGERAIDWCLQQIRHGLDTGDWPGHQPFKDGTLPIQMKPWEATRLDDFLTEQDQLKSQTLEVAE